MSEDSTLIDPVMPPVDSGVDTQDSSMDSPSAESVEEVISNPATRAAPVVSSPSDADDVVSPIVEPDVNPSGITDNRAENNLIDNKDVYTEVASKIRAAKNILVALSSNPSVDEMSAAIGLSLYLDKLGKRATAIYSGATPNALEFLKPEETFESTADTLQDFVIALNKEKADHLRYKLDGEFVKIYITPYKTRISDNDLEFSYGDYNVDLVLALDVANGIDLDSALREHGRIMHDAVIVNVSTSKPGKFGEIEWSDKKASSVSEMIANLLYTANDDVKIGKEEATAFLTGIVAATNRFANAKTTPETMKVASKLMKSGANQQLVSKNITPDVENEIMTLYSGKDSGNSSKDDSTKLDIAHDGDRNIDDDEKEVDADIADKESTLLDDLKAAEESLSQAGAEAVDEPTNEPMKIDTDDENNGSTESLSQAANDIVNEPAVLSAEKTEPTVEEVNSSEDNNLVEDNIDKTELNSDVQPVDEKENSSLEEHDGEKVVQPEAGFETDVKSEAEDGFENEDKYGHLLEEALGDNGNNPAAAGAPSVPSAPEINGVPEMNYAVPSDENILPPPPAPPVDMMNNMPPMQENLQNVGSQETALPEVKPIESAAPSAEPTLTSLGSQPAMQDQVYNAQATDPGAFKIPGM